MTMPQLSRRRFGQAVGSLVLSFSLAPRARRRWPQACPVASNANRMLDAWLRIDADGTATIFPGKVELGQGILTALAQIAAEELDLPLQRVLTAPATPAQVRMKVSPRAASRWKTAAPRCVLPVPKPARS